MAIFLLIIAALCAFVVWAVCRVGSQGDLLGYTQPRKDGE